MMEVSKGNPADTFVDIGSSVVSFQKLLASQKDLLHSQVNQLQKIVVTQCSLTGANPLSQEMAAGSLSIKIGKRPRDLLNPKAVKYMQSVFSIKDVISKKESREISALCGVTITQVREFFAGQRSRVRKFVRFSKEKVVRSNASRASLDGCSVGSDSAMCIDQDLVNSKDSKAVGEVPSCLSQEEALPVIDNSDKNFLENIFNLMRKEETFIGQVRLIEWILQIENSSVLYWFLTKGGLMILTTWLSQAALEEQTTVLRIIFKVLCHLPLHKTLPVHMSAVLQSVNRLRFYRIPDVSNRARELLAKWSKLFARSQALKKPTSMKLPNAAQKEIIQKQRKGEILCDESWQSKADIPAEILSLTFDGSENSRKSEPPRTLKLLTASADATNRGHIRSVSSHKTRERRKILLVEQPGQKTSSRNPQVGRALPLMQGRPISSDDIQKAKMRAQFMQSKYGKIESSSNDDHKRQKLEDPMKLHESGRSNMPSSSKTPVQLSEENAIPAVLPSTIPPSKSVATIAPKSTLDHQEYSQERFRREQTSWLTPPEVRINSLWRIGTGESSKEIEVQIERIRREKGTIYHSNQEIPPNPKEPWDIEIDYDDSLTPEIPIEQPLDADVTESVSSAIDKGKTPDASAASVAATSKEYCPPVATSSPEYYPTVATTIGKQSCPPVASTSNGSAPEPDLELLAVLLNNPQLVFALTSGQGGSVPDAETVRLLDMIKASGIGLPGMVGGKAEEKVEVTSLPSPTPGSDHSMGGWRSEVGKDRFPQPVSAPVNDSVVTSSIPSSGKHFPGGSVQHQIPYQNFFPPQISNVVPQQHQNAFGAVLPERQHPSSTPFLSQQSSNPTIHPFQLNPISETVLPAKQSSYTSSAPLQAECRGFGQLYNPNPATVLIERPPTALQPLPASLRHQPTPYQPLLAEAPPIQSLHNTWQPNATGSGRRAFVSAPQNVRQFAVSSNHYQANQNNHNVHSHGNVGEPELETWSPEGSPVRPPSYQSGRNFHQPRSDYGWNSRRDHQSRQNNPGYRERRHDRRWRERRH